MAHFPKEAGHGLYHLHPTLRMLNGWLTSSRGFLPNTPQFAFAFEAWTSAGSRAHRFDNTIPWYIT
jgi:hypothetical protein